MYNGKPKSIPIVGGNINNGDRSASRSLDDSLPCSDIPEEFKYKLYPKPIGKGSFSTVYLGLDKHDRQVAVKKIKLKKLPDDRYEKFLLELEISKKLDHKNIVKCFDTLRTPRHWYVVTEYCDAGTLKDFIKELNTLDPSYEKEMRIREILSQLVDALKYMREQNILHRDLKPMNILFSQDQESGEFVLKLADFGFSRYFRQENISKDGYDSMIETVCGSPIYMAPEMLLNSTYNIKADLWSFGVIMYEMLYKTNPYNYPKNIAQLRELMIAKKIVFPEIYSDACLNLVKSLLVIDPKSRIDWDKFFDHKWFKDESPSNSTTSSTLDVSINAMHEKIKHSVPVPTGAPLEESIAEIDADDFVIVKQSPYGQTSDIYESYAFTGSFIKIVSRISRFMKYIPGLSKSV